MILCLWRGCQLFIDKIGDKANLWYFRKSMVTPVEHTENVTFLLVITTDGDLTYM